ncbi:hypothetical protein [Larkinella terrae]|uniref:Uncharacterized protein n=1 Tax=Larkinella terrae TaxID=2025311 RepID=A0A7K0EQQ0_9BACT|nr:hypothetical protein [Larkinella terrae]MRS64082.1 hypothetical protein [Larkinella terrae]
MSTMQMMSAIEKGIMDQLATNPTKISKMTPNELDQMMQRIAGVVDSFTGVKMNWELPTPSDKPTQQQQAEQLAALYLGV